MEVNSVGNSAIQTQNINVKPQNTSDENINSSSEKIIEPNINEKDTFEKGINNNTTSNKPQNTKEKIINFCKTFVKTGEYFKAIGATVIYGGILGGAIMFSNLLFKGLPKILKQKLLISDLINKPLKYISTSAKVSAGIVVSAIGGYEFAKTYLKTQKQNTDIKSN